MLGIRQKLSLGFGGLLVVILVIGFQSIVLLTELGDSIDVILQRELSQCCRLPGHERSFGAH